MATSPRHLGEAGRGDGQTDEPGRRRSRPGGPPEHVEEPKLIDTLINALHREASLSQALYHKRNHKLEPEVMWKTSAYIDIHAWKAGIAQRPEDYEISFFVPDSSNEKLYVIVNRADASDAEVLHKHLGDIRREERREGRAEMDVLHAKVQERQENDYRFLLVPRDVECNRQFVDVVMAESLLELQRDERERIRIVALPSVEDARDAVDVAKAQFVVLVLRASRREKHDISRQSLEVRGLIKQAYGLRDREYFKLQIFALPDTETTRGL